MEPSKILAADVLDIVFEGRNKEYGAYDLRRTYNRRLVKAILITSGILLLSFAGCAIMGKSQGEKLLPKIDDVTLDDYKEKKVEPVIPPPAPKIEPPKVEMKQFTPPKVVPDDKVKPDEKPPEQDKLDDVKIGTVNQDGVKDDGAVTPPVSDAGKGVVEAPKKEDEDVLFTKVEIESTFPGGPGAWLRFLNKNLHYPDDAMNNEISGRIMVRFIVDKDGNVSDVEAVSGPEKGGLREEAIRVIKKSGKWTPAQQNGRYVKSYKQQPVTFEMPKE